MSHSMSPHSHHIRKYHSGTGNGQFKCPTFLLLPAPVRVSHDAAVTSPGISPVTFTRGNGGPTLRVSTETLGNDSGPDLGTLLPGKGTAEKRCLLCPPPSPLVWRGGSGGGDGGRCKRIETGYLGTDRRCVWLSEDKRLPAEVTSRRSPLAGRIRRNGSGGSIWLSSVGRTERPVGRSELACWPAPVIRSSESGPWSRSAALLHYTVSRHLGGVR